VREIKFRAWDKENRWMEEIDGNNLYIANGKIYEVCDGLEGLEKKDVSDRYILMQCTGLKDKSGKEIYEGDIIRIRETEFDDWQVYLIEYHGDRDYPAFDTEPSIDCDSNGLSYATACCELEVIGNIFENPELLEVPR
jgi:uncharacterized phage protein (TIGR01671 family)